MTAGRKLEASRRSAAPPPRATVAGSDGGARLPAAPGAASVVRMQRTMGNAVVQRLLAARGADTAAGGPLGAEVEGEIHAARGGGSGLDTGTRAGMEEAFGADLSGVRVHADARADRLSRALSARAFTTGRDVFFRAGEYRPGTSSGKALLAHELTHVLQQGGASAPVQRALEVGPADDPYEREAEGAARSVAAGEPVGKTRTGSRAVRRDLAAYKQDHEEILPPFGHSASVTTVTYRADAPALQAALGSLVTAGKVAMRDGGDRLFFSGSGATRAEIEAALTAAAMPRAADLGDALLNPHNTYVYSRERVTDMTSWFLFWSTTSRLSTRTNVVERQSSRPLTAHERAQATLVFGPGLDYGPIRVSEDPVMSVGGFARTLPNHAYFPTGSFGSGNFMPWLIHELTHAWQYQHGYGVGTTGYHAIFSSYDYGGEAGLRAATAAGRGLRSFNTEQQGDILQDYYVRLTGGQDTTAWAPFVAEARTP
ncbi:MAG TPA: DUF4157 domain-containing protein [Longimicrobiaceae bacterium]